MTGKIAKGRYYLDGVEVTRAEFWRAMRRSVVQNLTTGPCSLSSTPVHASEALAFHPDQVAEATAYLKRVGIPTEIQPTGEPIIRSRAHLRELVKHYGYYNRDGGWGDG